MSKFVYLHDKPRCSICGKEIKRGEAWYMPSTKTFKCNECYKNEQKRV